MESTELYRQLLYVKQGTDHDSPLGYLYFKYELFAVGTPRSMLLAEFGMPAVSELRDGKKYEIFKFVQDYSAGAKLAGLYSMEQLTC
jgi:hypothetical protein